MECRGDYSIVKELCLRCGGTFFCPRCRGTQQVGNEIDAWKPIWRDIMKLTDTNADTKRGVF